MHAEQRAGASTIDIGPQRLQRVVEEGAAVIPGVFSAEQVDWARQLVLSHRELMPNTRAAPSSRHLAGFHRFPALEPLHLMMTGNDTVRRSMHLLCGERARTIGLTDITVNRSQQWHKDLLRGRFRRHLGEDRICERWHGTVFKLLVYLQDSDSLSILPGSNRCDIDLTSDEAAVPVDGSRVVTISVKAGDAVIIDICTTHRGSEESRFLGPEAEGRPKILVSTVFARHGAALTDRMERGNADRLTDWTSRHLA